MISLALIPSVVIPPAPILLAAILAHLDPQLAIDRLFDENWPAFWLLDDL
jgi:hypothetical protein